MSDSVFEYYRRQELLPTFGDFKTREALDRHIHYRKHLFEEKLHLPIGLFKQARVVEFGPDSGENALACAHWGARLSLVEPNPKAVERIRAYFDHFSLTPSLEGLFSTDLATFGRERTDPTPFDFIIAEGFLNAVRPDQVWIDLFKRILAPEGFAVIYTHDPAGMFTDLLLKAIYGRVRQLTGLGPNEAGRLAFQGKWDAIPHMRTLESWIMDQMENPFIRLDSCHDAIQLGRALAERGLRTYSSWPPMVNTLEVSWHRSIPKAAERLEHQERFHRHHQLSYLFGRPLFCRKPVDQALLDGILRKVDGLIDGFDPEVAASLAADLEALRGHLQAEAAPLHPEDATHAATFLASIQAILALLTEGDPGRIAAFCNSDAAFIRSWGLPVHFRVLRHAE